MKKGFSPILIILLGLLIIGGTLFSINYLPKKARNTTASPTETVKQEPTEQPTDSVPLPTEEDIIRNFFQLINEKRIPEAISMMTKETIGDDSTKQAWGVHFNNINSIKVLSIEKSEFPNQYKVNLDVKMNPDSANAPIPYYGWQNGENMRFITLEKEDNLWKIKEIATGP